jgi:diguanylate cyclase (GGDEF)-like protein/PAS domain S-box-containing protein
MSEGAEATSGIPMDVQPVQHQSIDQAEGNWYSGLLQPNCPPVYIYDAQTLAILDANDAALALFGCSREEFLRLNLKDICLAGECFAPAPGSGEAGDHAFRTAGIRRQIRKDGSVIWVDVIAHGITYRGKKAVLVIATDLTQQMKAAKPVPLSELELNAAQAVCHVGSWTWNVGHGEMNWSDEAFRLYGYQPGEMKPTYHLYRMGIHPDDRPMVDQAFRDALAGSHNYGNDHRIIQPKGEARIVHECGLVRRDDSGQPVGMIGTVEDVTRQRRAEQLIQQIAFYDDVTGLPNRRKFREDLEQALQTARQRNRRLVVLIIQLERLREINFTLGQANGDLLLRQIAPRLKDVLPPDAFVARIGDVQFATFLLGASAFTAAHTSEHIIDALNRPFDIAGVSFAPGAHIGAALYPVHGEDADTLIQHANVAVFQARSSGKDYVVYSPAHDPYKPQRLSMLGEFRHAVETGQLLLYCQPKEDLGSGNVVGAEALVRWQHPRYGLVSPIEFIPLIEPTELIQPLTEWMLESAISECYAWRQDGLALPLAVNLSARNLHERNLADLLGELLNTWGADTSWLDLEITESSIMTDPAAGKKVIEQLHRSGFRLFVDDYGTGYSSLSYLMRLPVDFIKIDQSFVMSMLTDRPACAIVKSSIELAHNLEMKVVAEGTASREIRDALKSLGCDQAQGNVISAPMPAGEFRTWLRARKSGQMTG